MTEARSSPYKGLIPYDERDAPFFFGRDRDIRRIRALLFASPLTLVFGPSGVGKTSVLHAGVVPRLRERDDVLVVALREWHLGATSRLKEAIREEARRLGTPLKTEAEASLAEHVSQCAAQLDRRPMIILDQFESYFLYPANRDFQFELPEAAAADVRASFLISIREDAVARLDQFGEQLPGLFETYLRVDQLDRGSAAQAIVEPIDVYNSLHEADPPFKPAPDLVDAVLMTVDPLGVDPASGNGFGVERQIETPFLQLVLTDLWETTVKRGQRELTPDTLASLGGAHDILARHVARAMNGLTEQEQDVSQRIFHYLVTPSGSKIAHTARDLAFYAQLPDKQVGPVLQKLAGDARILRPVPPPLERPTDERFEIFHDVLAQPILAWRPQVRASELEVHVELEPEAGEATILHADGVFAAGGIKALAIAGALVGFAEHPTKAVTRWMSVAGTGGGAIVAALLAAGRSPSEIEQILQEANFAAFRDPRFGFLGYLVAGAFNLFRRGGLASGDYFRRWLDQHLEGRTFGDVKAPDGVGYGLRLIAADVTHGQMLVLPDDLASYRLPFHRGRIDPADFSIADAVRMSMSIPFFFEPVELIHGETGDTSTILDGGLFAELPVWLFDAVDREATWPTFGIQVASRAGASLATSQRFRRLNRLMALGNDIFRTTSDSVDKRFMSHATRVRTCVVDAGTVKTTDFDLPEAQKQALLRSGRAAAHEYLDRFDVGSYENVFGRGLRAPASGVSA